MNSVDVGASSTTDSMPQIPDHVLIRRIGKGGYGDVWLARNMVGAFRAAKVIYRGRFIEARPFQREFEGLCKFESISHSHPGLVKIFHVGQDARAGHFYYLMELADDARTGQIIDADAYLPRTLREALASPKRLPLQKSLGIALSLTSALAYLHAQGLIHRDIKPSNIIFVNGLPKFADIGLITELGDDISAIGSVGFMPPEGPGEVTGDIFSLGKVFYELFMGMPCKSFPELPGAAEEFTTVPALLQLNNLILKACHKDPKQRFQSAAELHETLSMVGETVQEERPSATAKKSDDSDRAKLADAGAKTPLPADNTSTGTPPAASREERPRVRLSRRAALLVGVPTAVGGAFFFGEWISREGPKKKFYKWQALYELLDDKLACFIGYVGTVSPSTKFLVYSRGTDANWITPGFQEKWVKDVEERFPELKGDRIETMTIGITGDRKTQTFKYPKTAEKIREKIKLMLDLPARNAAATSPNPPVVVLMDTTAARGVYDEENKVLGITNAEVLQNRLGDLPLKSIPLSISDLSSKRRWDGERRVLGYGASLVVIHRSAFFHVVNAELDLGYPLSDSQGNLIGWEE